MKSIWMVKGVRVESTLGYKTQDIFGFPDQLPELRGRCRITRKAAGTPNYGNWITGNFAIIKHYVESGRKCPDTVDEGYDR